MDRKRLLSLTGAVVIVGGAIALVVASRHRAAPAPASVPHEGLDFAMAPLDVMFTTPDAATPCETAYNAMRAGQDAAAAHGKSPLFAWIADRDTFLRVCSSLPPDVQQCVAPRYARDHHDECHAKRPPGAVLDQIYKPILGGGGADMVDEHPPGR